MIYYRGKAYGIKFVVVQNNTNGCDGDGETGKKRAKKKIKPSTLVREKEHKFQKSNAGSFFKIRNIPWNRINSDFHLIVWNCTFISLFLRWLRMFFLHFFIWYKSHMFFSYIDNYEFTQKIRSRIQKKKMFQENEEAWHGHKARRPTTKFELSWTEKYPNKKEKNPNWYGIK